MKFHYKYAHLEEVVFEFTENDIKEMLLEKAKQHLPKDKKITEEQFEIYSGSTDYDTEEYTAPHAKLVIIYKEKNEA